MNKFNISVFIFFMLITGNLFAQSQRDAYIAAARAYRTYANKTKCPERARVLRIYAEWNECMVRVLAGESSGCGPAPTMPIPPCNEDGEPGKTSGEGPAVTPQEPGAVNSSDNSVSSLISGISELAAIKVDNNKESNSWFLISGGVNLNGDKGPLFGTTADMGKMGGSFLSFQFLERKGLSFSSNCVFLKSDYFHSFRAKGTDGQWHQYIGKTQVSMTSVDLNIGKDFTGESGSFHFVPGVGANLILNIDNTFTSSNKQVEYSEEWDKDLFFALNGSVQMFYLFSKRLGLQGGMRYFYFPTKYGTAIKTGDFFNFNIGLAIRII